MSREAAVYDYRQSHVEPGRGAFYDRLYRPGTALAFYWQHFEGPYLKRVFEGLRLEYPTGRYLDFACGTGRILQFGARYFENATGIDVSESMLSQARAKVPAARIIKADVLTTPVDVGPFEVITLFRFLLRAGPHLRHEILQWLRGVIADDGTLIVNNHRNAYSLRGLAYRASTRMRPNGFEGDLLTDPEVVALLHECGFEVVERTGFALVPSIRGRLLLPRFALLALERLVQRTPPLAAVAKNRIYICRPRRRSG